MLRVGLTGNIGSGKSTVARIFSAIGIPVYHADDRAKEFLMQTGVRKQLTDRFGGVILGPDGLVDKRMMASVVFSDPVALKELNDILHPLVMNDFNDWAVQFQTPYVLQEAAIIVESGFAGHFDTLIHVSCLKEVAIGRVMRRDGVDEDAVLRRLQFQMEDEEKSTYAEFRIRNDGRLPVIPQVLAIHRNLCDRALK